MSEKVICDICGQKISMGGRFKDTIPVHTTAMGSQYVHPAHALWGFPLPKSPTLNERFETGYVPLSPTEE